LNKHFVFILGLFLLLLAAPSQSQTRPRESLRGLNGVFVYIQPLGKDVEAGGLSRAQVQKLVEKQLQDAGIPIHSAPQPADGSANLAVIIDTVKSYEGAFLYEVNLSLLQEVRLERRRGDPDPFPAETWGAKALGITGANQMNLIIEPLKARVSDFIADYVAVNPKGNPAR
jgi:hypothetical protein